MPGEALNIKRHLTATLTTLPSAPFPPHCSPTHQGQPAAAAEPSEVIPESAVPVLVLYGTEYGFAREIAEKVASSLKDGGQFW